MTTAPRYFFGAMPPPESAEQWLTHFTSAGVVSKLGRRLFPMQYWHQSLSGRHFAPTTATIARLMQAGERISAHAVTLRLNRIKWSQGEIDPKSHCTLLAQGRPQAFDFLLAGVQEALRTMGLADDEGHRPHVTLSYDAGDIHPTMMIIPIEWKIDEVLLLKGHGNPYRYDIIGRWPLASEIDPPAAQMGLF